MIRQSRAIGRVALSLVAAIIASVIYPWVAGQIPIGEIDVNPWVAVLALCVAFVVLAPLTPAGGRHRLRLREAPLALAALGSAVVLLGLVAIGGNSIGAGVLLVLFGVLIAIAGASIFSIRTSRRTKHQNTDERADSAVDRTFE